MYKLIDKIPENIPDNMIEEKIINYKSLKNPEFILRSSFIFYHALMRFNLVNGSELYPISKDPEIRWICDLYETDSFGLLPKKWIDKAEDLYFYNNIEKKYYHIIIKRKL